MQYPFAGARWAPLRVDIRLKIAAIGAVPQANKLMQVYNTAYNIPANEAYCPVKPGERDG